MEKLKESKKIRELPELLAPAGSWNAFLAAIQNGADAVYLGLKDYSARQDAENFSIEEMEAAIRYAHIRGVRLYVTFNTLISESQFPAVLSLVEDLAELGIDGLIIQDFGLAAILRSHYPELPLHGSTQMTIHNSWGADFLAQWGFSRVVVARETSLHQLQEITRKVPEIEVEAFVHGALCFSYSGNCLLSSLIGGRSGNRGRCAQPCRLEYSLVNSEGKVISENPLQGAHLLSPKDLNTLEYLGEIVSTGVHSLKIEGRMKRPEYVATVVKAYRRVLDHIGSGQDLGDFPLDSVQAEVEQIFNRGFTTGYYFGNPGVDLMSYSKPSNRGRLIGEVKSSSNGIVWIELYLDLEPGDGIEIWSKEHGQFGVAVKNLYHQGNKGNLEEIDRGLAGDTVGISADYLAKKGDLVYRNREASLLKRAESTYKSEFEVLQIPIQAKVKAVIGEPLEVLFCDENRLCGIGKTDYLVEVARRHPTSIHIIKEQLSRLGNTPFKIVDFNFELDPEVMIPKSELNKARRAAVEGLERLRQNFFEPVRLGKSLDPFSQEYLSCQKQLKKSEDLPQISVVVDNFPSLESALRAGAEVVYLAGTGFDSAQIAFSSASSILEGIESCLQKGAAGIYLLPPIISENQLQEYGQLLVDLAKADVPVPIGVGDLGQLHYVRSLRTDFVVDSTMNTFNSYSVSFLDSLGASQVTLSPELTLREISTIAKTSRVPLELQVQGPQMVMLSEHCILGSCLACGKVANRSGDRPCEREFGLKDRLGKVFPIRTDRSCRTYLFNSVDHCLIEHLWDIHAAGINRLRIEGRLYSPEQLQLVIELYLDGWRQIYSAKRWDQNLQEVLTGYRNKLEAGKGITKGHFFRGVI